MKSKKWLIVVVSSILLFLALLIIYVLLTGPRNIVVTNVTDRALTITWTTSLPSPAVSLATTDGDPGLRISSGDLLKGFDDRDLTAAELRQAEKVKKSTSDTLEVEYSDLDLQVSVTKRGWYYVHHVTITGLEPETEYSILNSNGVVYLPAKDTDGDALRVKTNKIRESLTTPDPTYGKVGDTKGDLSKDGVVYMQVSYTDGSLSQPLSSPVRRDNGTFFIDISSTYDLDGNPISSDKVVENELVWVEGGPYGRLAKKIVPSDLDAPMDSLMMVDEATVEFNYENIHDPGGISYIFLPELPFLLKAEAQDGLGDRMNNRTGGTNFICSGACNNSCRRPPCKYGAEAGCGNGEAGVCESPQERRERSDLPACSSPKICVASERCTQGWATGCDTGTACEDRTDDRTLCGTPVVPLGDSGGNRPPDAPHNFPGVPATRREGQNSRPGEERPDYRSLGKPSLTAEAVAQIDDETQNVLYDPANGAYYVVNDGEYSITYEGVQYTVVLPQGGTYYTIFLDDNSNGLQDEGETVLSSDVSQLELAEIADVITYQVKAGLNLISIPMILSETTSAGELLADLNEEHGGIFYSIAKYDGSWKVVGENMSDFNVNDFMIVPGSGYVLKSKTDVEIQLTGKSILYEEEGDSAPIMFKEGWNLVGLYGTNTIDLTAESLIDSINSYTDVELEADNVSKWSTNIGRYEGFQKTGEETFGFDFALDQYNGYFVRILQGTGQWQPLMGDEGE